MLKASGRIAMNSVLDEITGSLAEVLGAEPPPGIQITPETSFREDLALDSVEFFELLQKLQRRYGEKVNLLAFVAHGDIDSIEATTVGGLADYIGCCAAFGICTEAASPG
jgi:acyl carrier protein